MAESPAADIKEPYSIEFRGLGTHYTQSEGVKASLRYTTGVYQSRPGDWIGLFPTDANSPSQYEARVSVSDPSTHRPCDGGLWKTADVLFAPEALSGIEGGAYSLWYVRGASGEGGRREIVAGKSESFNLSEDKSGFLDVQMPSGDTLTVHSPTSIGSSFVLVPEEDEFATCTPPKSRDHSPRGSHDHSSEEHEEGVIHGLEHLNLEGTESKQGVIASVGSEGDEILLVAKLDHYSAREGEEEEEEEEENGEGEALGVGLEPVEGVAGGESDKRQESGPGNLGDLPVVSSCPEDDEGSETTVTQEEAYLRRLSLSESAMLPEGEQSEDIQYLKGNNRDLRKKVRKLTEKLAEKDHENESLLKQLTKERDSNAHLQAKIAAALIKQADLQNQLHDAAVEKQHLLEGQKALKEEVHKLEEKVSTASEQSSRALQELEACETKLQVEKSERSVLEEKLARTEKELERNRRKAASEQAMAKELETKQRMQPPRQKPTNLPLTGVREKPTATAAAGHSRQTNAAQPIPRERHGHRHVHGHHEGASSSSHGVQKSSDSHASKRPVPQERRQEMVYGQRREGRENGYVGNTYREADTREKRKREGEYAVERKEERKRDTRRAVEARIGEGRHGEQVLKEGEGRSEERKEGISEGRVVEKLKGNATLFVCPVCQKQLPARETEYSATLHVEHCLAQRNV